MINRVVLVGRLTRDIEIKKTSSNVSFARFTIACNRRFTSQGQDQADFISCVAWRQSADFLGQYARKGALIGLEGRIQTGSYDRGDGQKVYTTDVVCDSVQILESRQVSEQRQTANYNSQPSYNGPSYSGQMNQGFEPDNSYSEFQSGPTLDISSDDLPF